MTCSHSCKNLYAKTKSKKKKKNKNKIKPEQGKERNLSIFLDKLSHTKKINLLQWIFFSFQPPLE